jgi:hypothetical protein
MISYICKKIHRMLKQSELYKTYIRFNREEKIFEEIVLGREHQERLDRVKAECEFKVSMGDLVRVRDGSGNLDFDNGAKRYGIDPLFKENPALVMETNLSFITEPFAGLGEKSRYVLDLLLLFPGGERVYTSTTFVEPLKDVEWRYYGTLWPKWERIR